MADHLAELLSESFGHALETMAFISPEPVGPASRPPLDAVIVQLDFTGGAIAGVDLLVDRSFGHALAANIMGEEELGFVGADVLLELINVTAGTFLRKTMAQKPEMNVPRIAPFSSAEWSAFVGSQHTTFLDADGHTVAVRLRSAA